MDKGLPPQIKMSRFLKPAMEYYAAARFLFLSNNVHVSGNLFHHAVEMFLKAGLVLKYTESELKSRYGHKLVKLWTDFKKYIIDDTDISEHDLFIMHLNKWKEIRYPGEQDISILYGQDSLPKVKYEVIRSQRYTILLDDVDKFLLMYVTSLSPLNPSFLIGFINAKARDILWERNKFPIIEKQEFEKEEKGTCSMFRKV